jgi:subtilisin family serine protease
VADNFPNRRPLDGGAAVGNWIEVGASTRQADISLPASFSNYGRTGVDLFAPGQDIYSSVPGNQYASFSGTSMASPEVAGIAALVLSQYPQLTAAQLRQVLLASVQSFKGLKVMQPGSYKLVDFAQLSVTGGVVNAFNALEQARQVAGGN